MGVQQTIFIKTGLLLLALAYFSGAHGQLDSYPAFPAYTVSHYDDGNGLPSNDIEGFVEDRNGFFWLATQFGIARFDGSAFRLYNSYNSPAFHSNRFAGIAMDSAGVVYIRDEKNQVFYLDSNRQPVFSPSRKGRENFLVGGHGFLLDLRAAPDLPAIGKELAKKKYDELAHPIITTGRGKAYFFSTTDVVYFDGQAFHTVVSSRADLRCNLGEIMITLQGNIFTQYLRGIKLPVQCRLDELLHNAGDSLQGDAIPVQLYCNQTGSFLKNGSRIYTVRQNGTGFSLKLLLDNLDLGAVDDIYYASAAGLYLLRTKENGFYLVRKKIFTTRHYRDNLSANSFAASAEIRPGIVLTTNGIVFSRDSAIQVRPAHYFGTTTIFKDRDNTIWYVHRDSLYQADASLKTLRRFFVKDPYASSIGRDAAGVLWYACATSLGRVSGDTIVFEYLFDPAVDRTECHFLLNDSIHWLGTTQGLVEYNIRHRTIRLVPAMKGKDVRNIQRATDGTMWLGTYGQGFYTWRNGQFIALPLDSKQYLASAHCFMEDKKGFFWISTNKGLFQVLKSDLEAYVAGTSTSVYYYYYDKASGFGTNEFNGGTSPTGLLLANGTISLPSMNGLVWFDPDDITPELPASPLVIDKITAGNNTYLRSENITLPAAARRIGFEIASAYFGNPLNQQIEYTLDSIKDGWKPLLPDNTIVFSYLPAGTYTLLVRKRADFGRDHFARVQQTFSVAPFFYETTLFKTLLLLLSLLFITALFAGREMVTRARKRKLEALVEARTTALKTSVQQLSDTILELEESEAHLYQSHQVKDDLIAVVLHDIRSPLFIMGLTAQKLEEAIKNKDANAYTALSRDIVQALEQLNQFTKEFGGWLTIQQSGFIVKKDDFLLGALLHEINVFYQGALNYRGNTLAVNCAGTIVMHTDRQLLKTIVQNLIDNANKHTDKGHITISAVASGELVIIKVTDDGNGIHPDVLKTLQQRLSGDSPMVSEIGSQFGYKIVKDFVDKLYGSIAIDSVFQKGTVVTVTIPVSVRI